MIEDRRSNERAPPDVLNNACEISKLRQTFPKLHRRSL
jgi:hypothetical protein